MDATGTIVAAGHNRRVQQRSAVLHGEMDALERAGIEPITLHARDGLAIINGSNLTTGIGCLTQPGRRSGAI